MFESGRGSDNIGAGKQTTAIIAPNVTLGNNTRKRTNNANHWTTCLRGDNDDGADDGGHGGGLDVHLGAGYAVVHL